MIAFNGVRSSWLMLAKLAEEADRARIEAQAANMAKSEFWCKNLSGPSTRRPGHE